MNNSAKTLGHVVEQSRKWKAKAIGSKAALGLVRIAEHTTRVEKLKAQRDLANARLELEELKLWFAKAKSQGADVPEALTIRQLNEWRKLK